MWCIAGLVSHSTSITARGWGAIGEEEKRISDHELANGNPWPLSRRKEPSALNTVLATVGDDEQGWNEGSSGKGMVGKEEDM